VSPSATRRPSFAPTGLIAAALAVLIAGAALTWFVGAVVQTRAMAGLRADAAASAALHAAVLQSEMDKQRALPLVLADDADLEIALISRDPKRLAALSRKLETLADQTRAAVIYVVGPDGIAVAASNWRLPASFVGANYTFRPYFTDALKQGQAEQFALGYVSRKPGLFLARRVENAGGVLGVVVVKLEFTRVESAWRAIGEPAFVTDSHGVVLITSEPDWRFQTRAPLSPAARSGLRAQGQFGDAAFAPMPLRAVHGGVARTDTPRAGRQVETILPRIAPGWSLHLLSPTAQADQTVAAARWIVVLVLIVIAGLLFWVWTRRRRARRRTELELQARLDLERRVETRTHELTVANSALSHEVDERKLAETRLRALQADLVQANKLASLGQIAAGVAHEINQPVAAIRAHADNGQTFITRGRPEAALDNLAAIAAMTERIGRITDGLRAFSRKADGRVEPTLIAEVIEGSVLLTASRSRRADTQLVLGAVSPTLQALGERIRLEQVLVNLLQNAFEAVESRPDGVVALSVLETADKLDIIVSDNGPGLAPEVEQALFTPFLTTKPRGLGLGLVIAHDIVASFEGQLTATSEPGQGARFTVTLRKAKP